MEKLLIMHDGVSFGRNVETLLKDCYAVITANSAKQGLDILKRERIAVVLLDSLLPDIRSTELLSMIHNDVDPHLPVIIIADHADVDSAVEAMRRGASDFITKDVKPNHLAAKILKALERRDLEIRVKALQHGLIEQQNAFIFASDVMKALSFEITRIARIGFDLLLVGETGVGKDLIAGQVHLRSPRSDKPFIPISMRTLSETLIESELFGHEKGAFSGADKAKMGKFEAANGGTIYIPEISCLNEATQLKLQYFMQYKRIARVGQDPRTSEIKLDVRLVMATNESLEELVKGGGMREDFYHRITGVRLHVPPLRERLDDIEPLASYFLEIYSGSARGGKYEFAPETLDAMKRYHWPGNIRELENSIKNALAYVEGYLIKPEHFPFLTYSFTHRCPLNTAGTDVSEALPAYKDASLAFKKEYFQKLWLLCGQNVTRASKIAKMTPQGVRKILRSLRPQ